MTFAPDALTKLIKRNVAIVGVNYPRRDGGAPTAGRFNGGTVATLIATTKEKAAAGLLEEVEQMGLGLCLIEASVLQELQDEASREKLPLFHFELLPDGSYFGEDNFFFARARRLGFKVHVDHAVSWDVGHIGTIVSTHSGAANASTVHAPPGINSDETTFKQEGRWADGTNVRFVAGAPQVIGEYAKVFATNLAGVIRSIFPFTAALP